MKSLLALVALLAAGVMGVVGEEETKVDEISVYRPDTVPLKEATCKALNRAKKETKDIKLTYAEFNPSASKTLVMVHGWPSLWHSWKFQIEEFRHDYRVIAPNLRGFGASEHPGDVESSGRMSDMVSDLVCILEQEGITEAACIGHDWGSQVCYEAARMRPDIFKAVVGLCIPYIPYEAAYAPTESLVGLMRKLAYILFFEKQTSDATRELEKDVRRTLRATLRTVNSAPPDAFLTHSHSFLKGWESVPEIPPIPFLTEEEENYWVRQFEQSGFRNTFNFYTKDNRWSSWKHAQRQGNFTVTVPALSILPTRDPVADWVMAAQLLGTAKYVPLLKQETVPAAHWLQLELPFDVNLAMRRWLNANWPSEETMVELERLRKEWERKQRGEDADEEEVVIEDEDEDDEEVKTHDEL